MSFFNPKSVFIIAEMSANHCNNLDIAMQTIAAIAEAGADAVKVQTYKPDSLTINCDNEYFGSIKQGPWKGRKPWDLYAEAALNYEWHAPLQKYADSLGLVFFSSPFDLDAVAFLETLGVPLYKIASFEINHLPLIQKVARTGKPIIMSTGVADEQDIRNALDECYKEGNRDITLLKCTSEYPANIGDANLLAISDMQQKFATRVGLSDHAPGHLLPVLAVAMGAKVIEKHFILDRSYGGADAHFSMEPSEFKEMVDNVRLAETALGKVDYEVSQRNKNRRRSLFVSEDIQPGSVLSDENIRCVRPGIGLAPKHYDEILGRKASRQLTKGQPLTRDDFEAQ